MWDNLVCGIIQYGNYRGMRPTVAILDDCGLLRRRHGKPLGGRRVRLSFDYSANQAKRSEEIRQFILEDKSH